MQHLNERNVFTKTITIIQIMNEMCTWMNLVHRTNIGISPLLSRGKTFSSCLTSSYSCIFKLFLYIIWVAKKVCRPTLVAIQLCIIAKHLKNYQININ